MNTNRMFSVIAAVLLSAGLATPSLCAAAEVEGPAGRPLPEASVGAPAVPQLDLPAAAVPSAGAPAASAAEAPAQAVSAPAAAQTASAEAFASRQPGSALPPPAAPSGPKGVDGRFSYAARRRVLAVLATAFGVNYSLAPAGASLTRRLVQRASSKQAVFSDIDDTLAKYNTVMTPETAAAVAGVKKSGKLFVAITDRSDKVKPGSSQMAAFDSLESIPAAEREGLLIATNGGGKIYEYQADGSPKLIYEEPGLPESMRPAIDEAAAAVKARLPEFGTALKNEFHSPYGYGMILREGTPESAVKALAAAFQAELRKRGMDFEVEGRMAKDPTLPPYLTFSKLDKSVAVKRIAQLKGVSARRAVILGDSMYAPKDEPRLGALGRAAAALARRAFGPVPLTGNATDRNMERALRGALTLSVGGTADSRMRRAFVLDAKGPAATRRVLEAVGSRPAPAIAEEHSRRLRFIERLDGMIWQEEAAGKAHAELAASLRGEREYQRSRIQKLEESFPQLARRAGDSPLKTLLWCLLCVGLAAFVPALLWVRLVILGQ